MEIGGASGAHQQSASNAVQAKVLKSSNEQTEAVVGKLLQGVEANTARTPEQTGQNVDLVA